MALAECRTALQGSELHCYNTEGDGNSVVNQVLCRMDVNHEMSKFKHGEADSIRHISHHW